ncbi:MAG: metal ABC transporter permease [Saccharofermentans sp.]|jgi:zinc transport system permease protein|nr:metal ABC transporter permease [Clostridiales bacterium]MCR5049212.1 metal ABC transporter permease [Saccharofermentans sp.]
MDFLEYAFMRNALLAILISSPIFALLGTLVVNKKMAFFSDAIGHSALCGIAVGVVFGFTSRSVSMVIFAILFSVLLNFVKDRTTYGADTIISVFASVAMSLGLVLLSRGGTFNKYSSYLVGDILSITQTEIISLAVCLVLVIVFWLFSYNALSSDNLNRDLARSKGINGKLYDYIFSAFIAVVIMFSIRWIGILLINSLIILPAAASRNISRNTRAYHLWSVIFSVAAGIAGILVSYYTGAPSGPMIVLLLGGTFFITFTVHSFGKE